MDDIFFFIIDNDHIFHAHRGQFTHDLWRIQTAVIGLAARHRDGIIIEDLIGDIGARRQSRADRLNARVVVGPIAQVLKHMIAFGKRGLTDPIRAFGSHMGKAFGLAVHPLHHIVTANPGISPASIGDFGG